MKTHFAAAAVGSLVLTAGTLLGAPAAGAQTATATAYPTSNFNIDFGATWTRGTVTWYNRSIRVVGQNRSAVATPHEACRSTMAYALRADRSVMNLNFEISSACGDIKSYDFVVSADEPGGAAYARVCLADWYMTPLECVRIPRPL